MNDLLLSFISALTTLFDGNLGWAILALSLAARLALMPITLGMARKGLVNQRKIKALQPELEQLKERLRDRPQEMMAEMSKLYERNGVKFFDRSTLIGALLQLPVFALLYEAIKDASAKGGPFLWMKSLASPDGWLTVLVLVLSAVATYYFPTASESTQHMMVYLQVIVTGLFIWQLSAGLALYWLASSVVSVLQTVVLRWEARRVPSTF